MKFHVLHATFKMLTLSVSPMILYVSDMINTNYDLDLASFWLFWRSHLHWNCGHVMYILEGNMTSGGVRQTYNLLWKRWNRFKQFHFRSVLLTQTNWQWHLVRHFLYNCIHYCYTVVLCVMSKMVVDR